MPAFRFARMSILLPVVLLVASGCTYAQTDTVRDPVAPSQSAADEFSIHKPGWAQSVEAALIAGRFDDLDRLADQYRREKTRLKGGDWCLREFYAALDAPQQSDKDSQEHIDRLEQWMKLRPESITARIALSASLHRWAWVARGNGMANTVTADGWRLFDLRTKESQVVLEGSANMKTMDPQYYSEMLGVGLAQSWDEHRMHELFERGVQLEPDYHYLYTQYANYLLPKWDGHPGDASSFAKSSADKRGGDAGDMLYFQITTVLVKRGDGNFPVNELDWKRIQRGFSVLTAQYGATRKNQNQLAFMAYKFKDVEVAKQQFAIIGDDWAESVWRDRKFFDRIRDWSHGLNS